jgi:hypothetical protein
MEQAWTAIAAAKIQVLKTVMMVCWNIPAHYTHVLDLMTYMALEKPFFFTNMFDNNKFQIPKTLLSILFSFSLV